MRTVKLGLIAVLALGGLLAVTTNVSAQDAKEKRGDRRGGPAVQERVDRMATELQLTDEQKTKVKAVMEEQGKKMQELRDATPEQRREKFQAMREEMDKKMKAILTPEQQTKWEKMRENMRQRGGGPGGEKKSQKKAE